MNLLLIASLTIRESSRRRLVAAVAIVTLLLVALTAWGFHALVAYHSSDGKRIDPHDILMGTSTLEILMAFMFSFILAIGAAFLGALSTGNEIENGTLLAIVPRPVRRVEIVLGKWLGNLALIAAYAFAIAMSEFGVVRLITGYMPPHPVLATAFLIAESAIVLTLTLTLSVRLSAIAAGFTTVVLFGIAWMGGIAGSVAVALHNVTLQNSSVVLSLLMPSDGLWRAASYAMQPAIIAAGASTVNEVNPFVPVGPPPPAYLIWSACWLIVVLAIGIRSFQTRDI